MHHVVDTARSIGNADGWIDGPVPTASTVNLTGAAGRVRQALLSYPGKL